ncbi:hypothetical protein NQ318_022228 [Aromia moschata]
MRLAT